MFSQLPFIMDSCSLIESKNRYYAFDICIGFWDFILEEFSQGRVISIKHVYEEINTGNDELSSWLKHNFNKINFIDCFDDSDVISNYIKIAEYVKAEYKVNVADDFLREYSADPWLIAQALAHGGCIITQERPKPSKSKASLYDICNYFGVQHLNIIEFLRIEKAMFIYKKTT